MVFAKLWLLGILAAVLVSAATPPSSSPVVVRNEIPLQEQQPTVAVASPCPDTAPAQIAAAEDRLASRIDTTRQDLQTRLAESAASAAVLAERVALLEGRIAGAEVAVAEQDSKVRDVRGSVAAPMAMTWVLTGLAGAGLVAGAFVVARKWTTERP